MNLEYKKELIQKGIDNGNFPKLLYKYRTIDQAKKILDDFSFWFATPDTFNDPFDCGLSENQAPTLDDARKHFKRLNVSNDRIEQLIELYKRKPEKLVELVKNAKEKSIYSKGVLSLSEKYDDILMWSHYSQYHQGVVFGLAMEADLGFFVTPIRIDYKDSYEELNYLADPDKSTIDTLKIKSTQWGYESEIRIYKNESGLHKINQNAIREIYFGINTIQEDIDEIRRICSSKGLTNINFYKGEKAHGSFKVVFKAL
ncbi:DUF2971 domain-containing protein [Halomonas sp. DN3]|uniref:DUF2971 domain-containing protein n=1 Tax=Halomonas sp. DN3 TaxID=2953657 RepID=UPI0020A0BFD4|nr:DUF2971 domain-containing protein [Halomonas sp. DN3]USZ48452.1 DUF2971 domain-containing protein [Halomonas sp. DN3]